MSASSTNTNPALASGIPHSEIRIPHSRSRAPRVLYFTRILPQPGLNGSGAYSSDILDYLQRNGCDIRIVWTQTPDHLKYSFHGTLAHHATMRFDIRPHNCYRLGHHVFNPGAIWHPRKARALYFAKRLLQKLHLLPSPRPALAPGNPQSPIQNPKSLTWDSPCTPTERHFLYEHAASFKPDILLANYPWMLAGVEKKRTAPRHWVQTNDYRFRRCTLTPEGRFQTHLVNPEGRALEHRWLADADLLIAIQHNEAAAYAAEHPGKKILTACMSAPRVRIPPAPAAPIIALIGSDHAINQRSARWFIEKVWPIVLRHTSHARLRVAGRLCDTLVSINRRKRPRVELLGQVPDLATYYAGAAIAIVPIIEGSGVKIKLLEAISHDRATVTTSVGLDGLEFLRPALSVADTPIDFAAAITRLLTDHDSRDRQSARALELAHYHLTPEHNYAPLLSAARAALTR